MWMHFHTTLTTWNIEFSHQLLWGGGEEPRKINEQAENKHWGDKSEEPTHQYVAANFWSKAIKRPYYYIMRTTPLAMAVCPFLMRS